MAFRRKDRDRGSRPSLDHRLESIPELLHQWLFLRRRPALRNPKFAFLDEATSALDEDNQEHLYQLLKESRIGFISVGHRSTLIDYHDRILLLDRSGSWKISEAVPGQPGMSKPARVAVIEDGKAQAGPLYIKLFGRKPLGKQA